MMTADALSSRPRGHTLHIASLIVIGLAASGLGLWNSFTYDDFFIIVGNPLVHDWKKVWAAFLLPYWPLEWGGDGYRPLTIAAFTMQWAVSPGAATLFHAINIVLYLTCGILVFWLASSMLPIRGAWLAGALFLAHPVHVEAVASVVGQAELWAAALMLIGATQWIHLRRSGALTPVGSLLIAASFLGACLFKEHAIVLPLLLLWAETTVVPRTADLVGNSSRRRSLLLLLAVALLYVVVRAMILGRISGFATYPAFTLVGAGPVDRILTMLGVVPEWLRLFLWPARLATEYGPPGTEIATGLSLTQVPGMLLIAGVVGLAWTLRRRSPAVAFGLGWMIIAMAPTSNFFVPSGILLSERTLFAPSIGVAIVLAALAEIIARRLSTRPGRVLFLVSCGAALWLGVAQSIVRTTRWRSNDTLFAGAVKDAPMSYRAHFARGGWLAGSGHHVAAEREFITAAGLFPDPGIYINLGIEYLAMQRSDLAYRMFAHADSMAPGYGDSRAKMALTRAMQGRYAEAGPLAASALRLGVGDSATLHGILTAAALDSLGRARAAASYPGTRMLRPVR